MINLESSNVPRLEIADQKNWYQRQIKKDLVSKIDQKSLTSNSFHILLESELDPLNSLLTILRSFF